MDGFTLDPDSGKFLHTHKDIRIPSAGPIYSFNEANFHDFEVPVQRYLNALKEGSSSVGIRYVWLYALNLIMLLDHCMLKSNLAFSLFVVIFVLKCRV